MRTIGMLLAVMMAACQTPAPRNTASPSPICAWGVALDGTCQTPQLLGASWGVRLEAVRDEKDLGERREALQRVTGKNGVTCNVRGWDPGEGSGTGDQWVLCDGHDGSADIRPDTKDYVLLESRWTVWEDFEGLPDDADLAIHVMQHGEAPWTSGIWQVTPHMLFSMSGDWGAAEYQVTMRATQPPKYFKGGAVIRLRVSFGRGSSCSGFSMFGGGLVSGKSNGALSPRPDDLRQRQKAGECPSLTLKVWRDPDDDVVRKD